MVKPEELKVGQVVEVRFGSGPNATKGYLLIMKLYFRSILGVRVRKDGKAHGAVWYPERRARVEWILSIIKQPEERGVEE